MNFRIIKNLYKKEILDVLRDRKTVLMMLVVPLVLYPLLFIVGMQMMVSITTGISEHTYRVALGFTDEDGYFRNMLSDREDGGYSFEVVETDEPEEELKAEGIDAYVVRNWEGEKPCFKIYYMSAVTNSGYAADMLAEVLDEYAHRITVERLEAAGLSAEQMLSPIEIQYMDVSSNEESAGSMLGMLLPFMLVMSLLLGTMYPAIDTTAGERERGTLETVLTLPITNRELIISKFLTVATIGIVSALLNIISMCGVSAYMYGMMLDVSETNQSIDMLRFVPAILIGILCVFAFAVFISAITMCVCAFAKSYKEANNYITPLTLVIMFASFIGFVPNITLTSNMALVPVANICLLVRDLLAFKMDIGIIVIVLVSNIAYGIIAILFLGRIYNSESILFGDGSTSVQLFERRENMKRGGVPTMGDAWLLIAVTAVLIIYAGSSMQLKLGYYGVLGTQAIILIMPLIAAAYSKKSMRDTFRIKTCDIKYFIGGVVMLFGAVALGMVLTSITGVLFPSDMEQAAGGMEGLLGDSFGITLLVVALAPAVCEELMFRGYIFSAMEAKLKPFHAVLVSSAIFGVYHMSIVRFFTTCLLGMVICFAAYRTKSIFPGMLMHFINNALSVFAMYYPEKAGRWLPFLLKESLTISDMLLLMGAGLVLIALGRWIFRRTERKINRST